MQKHACCNNCLFATSALCVKQTPVEKTWQAQQAAVIPCLEMQLSTVPELLELLTALGPNLLVVQVEAVLLPGPPQSSAKGCITSCLLQYLQHPCQINLQTASKWK